MTTTTLAARERPEALDDEPLRDTAARVGVCVRPIIRRGTDTTTGELRHSVVSLLSNSGGVSIEDISHLVGHASTVVTPKVYRKELRPVLTRGAEKMDIVFKTEAKDEPVGQQLGQQVAESEKPNTEDEAGNPA